MRMISIFDTTISDSNLGNLIIMESVYKHLREIFQKAFFIKVPYMEITLHTKKYLSISDFIFFGGTNSLTGEMEKYKQWGISIRNFWYVKNVILMGVGWWQYQDKISFYTRFLLKHVLNKEYFHSVRDSYTENKLKSLSFENVLNTGCPTLWDLTEEHCSKIKPHKSDNVIIAFTDYNKNLERDLTLFDIVKTYYKNVYVWLQGIGDFNYIKNELRLKKVKLIPPDLAMLDKLLSELEVDYVGTRLHAGIRALQHRRRSIIIGIDNRALEMHEDFNLPVIPENSINSLHEIINDEIKIKLKIPWDNIEKWKRQFKNGYINEDL